MFTHSKLKIKRAEVHISDLNLFITNFMKNDFCELLIEDNVLKLKSNIKQLPAEIPLLLGDAIHNLRASLDLMACEIVTNAGGTISRNTSFPFRSTKKELETALNSGDIKNCWK